MDPDSAWNQEILPDSDGLMAQGYQSITTNQIIISLNSLRSPIALVKH